jgi:hypothetical protein
MREYNNYYGKNDRKIELPKETVHIAEECFKNQTKITKVTMHEHIKKIGTSAFEGCTNLEKVKIFGESELVVIPRKCFKNCSSLKEFSIPNEVGVIKKYAFKGCTSITHFKIPEHVIAVEAGAFDNWTAEQTIEMYSNFKFGIVCKATIINHALDQEEVSEDEVYETKEGKYMYAVDTKCGHVGRHRYMPITFPIVAESKKDAARIGRQLPRVKHDHKFAVLEVRQITLKRYEEIQYKNKNNPYLKMKSSYQQKEFKDLIDDQSLPEIRKRR